MRKAKFIAVALVGFAGLAACGDTVGEQALAGGVGTAAVTNGNLGTGAVIGAAANVAYCQSNPGACRSIR